MKIAQNLIVLFLFLTLSSCVTTKKSKSEAGWLRTKMHDLNAHFNGYWNANEMYKASVKQLEEQNEDNFNQVLQLYPYGNEEDRKLVEKDMDKAIEKVVKVASLHEPSKWVDDCYVMMGKAQYLKGDYESAQETLEYFVEDFNPKDPNSRVYQSPDRKSTANDKKKKQAEERKIQKEEREKIKEEAAKSRKQKAKERENARKEAEKERKQRNKDRKKGIKVTTPTPEVIAKEESKEAPVPVGTTSTSDAIPLDPDEEYLRQLESDQQKNANKKIEKGNSGGFLKHKPAYYEGMFWLVKTFLSRGKWIEANYFLDKLEKDEDVLPVIKKEVPVVRADYYLQQKDYRKAIPALINALEVNDDRTLKARMAFILAQAYQMNGQASEADLAFQSVKKYKTTFEMELHAELNQLKNSWAANNTTSQEATKKLERLANQDKNKSYTGSIYSTIAEIKLADGDQVGAMEYFKKALGASNGNSVKSEIYYRLGTLFFAAEDYLKAKNYYDSTLVVMNQKDPRFNQIKVYSTSLKDIAKNIQIITDKDSLLRLGALSDEDLKEFASKKAEKEWKINQSKAVEAEKGFQATTSVFSGNSKFFAYNQNAKQKGHQDFLKRWGNRPLEDDWRRSKKSSSVFDQEILPDPDEPKKMPDDILQKEVEKILRTLPRDENSRSVANKEVEKAMFELGTGFRTNINNYVKSNETLLRLLERYPESGHKPEAMYFIYLNYLDLEKPDMAESFKTRLIREFPDSAFAVYLKNPSNATALVTKEREIEMYYESAYELFETGAYQQTSNRLDEAKKQFGEKHHMSAKYELLKALCIGNLQGQEEYINALRGVILKYENTPEQTYAREMLRFLRGDGDTFMGEVSEADLQKYSVENEKLHYIIAVVYDSDSDLIKELKNSIEEFNKASYASKRLRVTSLSLNKEENAYVILLRRFTDKEDALIYYKDASSKLDKFANTKKYSYDIYAINQKNYRTVMQDKAIGAYRVFFDKEYLGIK